MESSNKFDYFMAGVTGAVLAFCAQNYRPVRLEFGPASLELVAMLLLAASFHYGLRRIECQVMTLQTNANALYADETAGAMTQLVNQNPAGRSAFNATSGETLSAHDLVTRREKETQRSQESKAEWARLADLAVTYYRRRNAFLYLGFGALLWARILPVITGRP